MTTPARQWKPTPAGVNQMLADAFPGTGNTCIELGPASALARRDIEPGLLRPGGFVSSPTQFALADAALWYLVFGAIGRVEPMSLTSELSTAGLILSPRRAGRRALGRR